MHKRSVRSHSRNDCIEDLTDSTAHRDLSDFLRHRSLGLLRHTRRAGGISGQSAYVEIAFFFGTFLSTFDAGFCSGAVKSLVSWAANRESNLLRASSAASNTSFFLDSWDWSNWTKGSQRTGPNGVPLGPVRRGGMRYGAARVVSRRQFFICRSDSGNCPILHTWLERPRYLPYQMTNRNRMTFQDAAAATREISRLRSNHSSDSVFPSRVESHPSPNWQSPFRASGRRQQILGN